MSLRIQLLGLGLLTLALPWAGYRYVQELEGALRAGLEQSLMASATTMAAALKDQMDPGSDASNEIVPATDENTLYAHPLATQPRLDGYRDDWSSPAATGMQLGDGGRFWVGLHDRTVYLFLSFTDSELVYQNAPGATPYGDRVLIRTESPSLRWLLLHTAAPGVIRAQWAQPPLFAPSGEFEGRVLGSWRETQDGFSVETRIPLDLIGRRLGLSVVDVDPSENTTAGISSYGVAVESSWGTSQEPDLLLYQPASLGVVAQQFQQPGRRLRIVNPAGWVLFDGGAINPLSGAFDTTSLTLAERFYRLILRRSDPPYASLEQPPGRLADMTLRGALTGDAVTRWYARGAEASAVVTASVPISQGNIVLGAVLLEQGSDSILTLTNAALVRLMSFTLLATLLVAVGLLSYATLLSFRVRRLARAADTALGPKGEIAASLPGRRAGDEIGDLARSFTRLLNRLSEYTNYLTTLKGKLAHELRTPLAVVSTSLDNLEREPHGENLTPYLSRLRGGADRLDAILNAMSEATIIEQAITTTEPEVFDVHPVLESCVAAYRDVYKDRRFTYDMRASRSKLRGSADLIAQMMDKLIDNAVSFSPQESTIQVALTGTDEEISVSVVNRGPTLPQAMRFHLFDSLVSIRKEHDEEGRHLGLGLYIVSLVAKLHGGSARCYDIADGTGVVFEIVMPVAADS